MNSAKVRRRLPSSFVLMLLLASVASSCGPVSVASPSIRPDIERAILVRQSLGLRSDPEWVTNVANDPTAVRRDGINVTVAEAFDLDERRLRKEVALRTQLGLVDDPIYVRGVLADPTSVTRNVGVPILMSPDEAAAWDRQVSSQANLREALDQYGEAHVGEWGGWYIPVDRPGAVALVTDHLDEHRVVLEALTGPDVGPVEVRQVEWTYSELVGFRGRVWRDEKWFDKHGVRLIHAEEDKPSNRISVKVEVSHPDLAAGAIEAVLDHFDATGWMTVSAQVDPYEWLGVGTLVVNVVDQAGRPVAGMTCQIIPAAYGAAGDNTILDSDELGRCSWTGDFAVAATSFRVEVRRRLSDPIVGAGRVSVERGQQASITIRVAVDEP
jgi:hypothetical protein